MASSILIAVLVSFVIGGFFVDAPIGSERLVSTLMLSLIAFGTGTLWKTCLDLVRG
jgi:hypothetical protein